MTKSVRYYSLLESSGYGLAALDYIQALLDAGVRVYWTPLVDGPGGYQPWPKIRDARDNVDRLLAECLADESQAQRLRDCLQPVEDYTTALLHLVPEYWPALVEPGKHNIGYLAWETTGLPPHWPALLNQVDSILVPARFNVEVLQNSGVDIPISVLPHVLHRHRVASAPVAKALKRQLGVKPGDFVFYTINEWSARKAIWLLIEAYLDCFSAADPVLLVIKTSPTGPRDEHDAGRHDTRALLREIQARYPAPARIALINEKISAEQIAALHDMGECFASVCHAEGWGLGAFEAAGHGNPVLITAWGGQLDYLQPELAALVPCREVPVRDRLGQDSYHGEQCWAEADPGATRALMQNLFDNPEKYRARAATLAHTLHQHYSPDVIGNRLAREIR